MKPKSFIPKPAPGSESAFRRSGVFELLCVLLSSISYTGLLFLLPKLLISVDITHCAITGNGVQTMELFEQVMVAIKR